MEEGARRASQPWTKMAGGKARRRAAGRPAGGGRRRSRRHATAASCTWKTSASASTASSAINKLSLDIAPGELRCIIGPNGAGKTTMMDIITGKTRPDAGSVFFGSTIDLLR
jgi:urea transport system ATP-binding protein